jgi:hypothetical protein
VQLRAFCAQGAQRPQWHACQRERAEVEQQGRGARGRLQLRQQVFVGGPRASVRRERRRVLERSAFGVGCCTVRRLARLALGPRLVTRSEAACMRERLVRLCATRERRGGGRAKGSMVDGHAPQPARRPAVQTVLVVPGRGRALERQRHGKQRCRRVARPVRALAGTRSLGKGLWA